MKEITGRIEAGPPMRIGGWKINWPDSPNTIKSDDGTLILNGEQKMSLIFIGEPDSSQVVNDIDWNRISLWQLARSFMKDGPTTRILYVYHDDFADIPEGKAIEIAIRMIDESEVVK